MKLILNFLINFPRIKSQNYCPINRFSLTKFTRYQLRFQWHFDLPVYFSIAVIVSFCLAEDSFRQYLPGHLSRYQDRLGETKLTMRIPLPRLRKKANKELYCQHQNSIKYSWPSYNCPIDTKISLLIHHRRIQPTSYPTPSPNAM